MTKYFFEQQRFKRVTDRYSRDFVLLDALAIILKLLSFLKQTCIFGNVLSLLVCRYTSSLRTQPNNVLAVNQPRIDHFPKNKKLI